MAAALPFPSFPAAQQAQIIRSNQRDYFHVSALRERTEGVLRAWLGTRWITRWDKEIDLCVKVLYYGLNVGRATQTLGEEYTDIWQHSVHTERPPSRRARAALVLLPTIPSYLLSKWGSLIPQNSSLGSVLKRIPVILEVLSEINLAIFYFRGTYYDIAKRVLGIRYLSSMPEDPNTRPPSYSLLGILLAVRLIHRFVGLLRSGSKETAASNAEKRPADNSHEIYIDDRPVSTMLGPADPDGAPQKAAEDDERTILDITQIPANRTASCATECGHLFCWDCIVGWGREKAECPLCRQSLNLNCLVPIYNL
ncbi:Pex12 amino terminal region-domain-containing protein [Amylocystis lapponica]|nr:Pex12 amino terminal region-domain-containing protein [Amylocystis lapponica]